MTASLVVRPVAPADREAWEPLWAGYNAFYERSGPTALAREITDTLWSRLFDDREPVFALVAEGAGSGARSSWAWSSGRARRA